ncbi:MAG: phage tail sheath protein FI, partial [Candidatus Krumholzibacteriia bacterium]
RTGLQAMLENLATNVSIIAIPGVTSAAVQTAMISHCESVGDRIAILDSASPNDIAQVQTQRAGLASMDGFGALYFPWIQATPTGLSLLLPPSGFVAGNYSATDPHQSPIGLIATATGVDYTITSPEQDQLNLQNINAIRDLSGIRTWGARTLSTQAEYRYIAVRRLMSFAHRSIYDGTLWCTFEENTPLLWGTIRQDVDEFLLTLFQAGWLQGTTPSSAYFSRCDQFTTTTLDILEGRTVIDFGLAIVRPAEFIVSKVIQQREDLSAVPSPESTFLVLSPPAPNPFNPATTLRFELSTDANVSLTIYDLAGHLVRRLLAAQSLATGEYQQRWNGRDDAGRAVSSGVYLVHLQAGAEVRTQRMVLAR